MNELDLAVRWLWPLFVLTLVAMAWPVLKSWKI